ncbi:hypothetical protein [Inmirania thermothiophila]|uniref:Uncharacterized protein n=1 Tax=Inmirania thermothiophila TaxID=1750597 RepID=A0A3N1Y7M3_9GAMM|nr:hypothetical protein [Inmirania thermothiophila]ROR34775.1 hypothetical protein EDC57_0679 [Inmirania thermothiophila]
MPRTWLHVLGLVAVLLALAAVLPVPVQGHADAGPVLRAVPHRHVELRCPCHCIGSCPCRTACAGGVGCTTALPHCAVPVIAAWWLPSQAHDPVSEARAPLAGVETDPLTRPPIAA